MIFASKSTLSLNSLKTLRPKLQKILQICLRSFVNPHLDVDRLKQIEYRRPSLFAGLLFAGLIIRGFTLIT